MCIRIGATLVRGFLKKAEFNKERDKEKDKEKDQVSICFECKKLRHIRPDCPFLKKVLKMKMKRAMVVTWSDDKESSSSDEEETTNLNLLSMNSIQHFINCYLNLRKSELKSKY